ncbi:MAG: AAA family ATPase [Methylobacter sp.]|jgi:wobble nucleotide-excising tRNase|nr:AAA family ATPase [Methylobacter sp.]
MIIKLALNNTATYTQKVEVEPTEINYLYGSNGSGKTTLSKVIANELAFPDCNLIWQDNPLETLVYNKEFVTSHFSQTIKGIFTLGKEATEAKEFIEKIKQEIEVHKTELKGLHKSFDKKDKEETELTTNIIDKCWPIKTKYQNDFKEAFTGAIGSKKSFFERCQKEQNNTSDLLNLELIKDKCTQIFSKSLKAYEPITELLIPDIETLENHRILNTKIVGKEDVPVGALIAKLNNSDWIKQGLGYLEHTENQCPFCQQPIQNELKAEIELVFDESYNQKIKELNEYKTSYTLAISSIIENLKQIIQRPIEILDFSGLKTHIRLLEEEFWNNIQTIEEKVKYPSNVVRLKSLSTDLAKAQEYITSYRKIIETNNFTAKNIDNEKTKLKSEIWRFIAHELSTEIVTYQNQLKGLQTGKEKIQAQINQRETTKKNLDKQITEKEANSTSIIHTKNEINKTLKSFGFINFSISDADKGCYKIVRQNGVDAKETLSEGEYTFITFLYFYQLIKGSIKESGLSGDKVVVIDDPISSLDSNVLFIVSNLVKEIIKDCHNKQNGIKQIFILTHNIYFHKEVTFKGSRQGKWKEESFWIVRNLNNQSNIIMHDENPIQTTYELLWREIKNPDQINKVTIFNTLRRILEYYFNIIGGLDYERSIDEFEGEEKIIFKSLFSWINDGSHFINDDLVVYAEPENIEKQLNVFKEIFKKLKHESHYNMMMGIENA